MQRAASPDRAASAIRKACPDIPDLAIVLGSGFAGLASAVKVVAQMCYSKIPGFPRAATAGHPGILLIGTLNGVPVLFLNGRSHFYEGYGVNEVTFPVRVLAALGLRDMLLTNAAGAINRRFQPGDFMV